MYSSVHRQFITSEAIHTHVQDTWNVHMWQTAPLSTLTSKIWSFIQPVCVQQLRISHEHVSMKGEESNIMTVQFMRNFQINSLNTYSVSVSFLPHMNKPVMAVSQVSAEDKHSSDIIMIMRVMKKSWGHVTSVWRSDPLSRVKYFFMTSSEETLTSCLILPSILHSLWSVSYVPLHFLCFLHNKSSKRTDSKVCLWMSVSV